MELTLRCDYSKLCVLSEYDNESIRNKKCHFSLSKKPTNGPKYNDVEWWMQNYHWQIWHACILQKQLLGPKKRKLVVFWFKETKLDQKPSDLEVKAAEKVKISHWVVIVRTWIWPTDVWPPPIFLDMFESKYKWIGRWIPREVIWSINVPRSKEDFWRSWWPLCSWPIIIGIIALWI